MRAALRPHRVEHRALRARGERAAGDAGAPAAAGLLVLVPDVAGVAAVGPAAHVDEDVPQHERRRRGRSAAAAEGHQEAPRARPPPPPPLPRPRRPQLSL